MRTTSAVAIRDNDGLRAGDKKATQGLSAAQRSARARVQGGEVFRETRLRNPEIALFATHPSCGRALPDRVSKNDSRFLRGDYTGVIRRSERNQLYFLEAVAETIATKSGTVLLRISRS